MIPEHAPILLDTGPALILARGREAARRLDGMYALTARREVPLLSIVSVGELLLIARSNGWGADKQKRLRELLENLVIVDIRSQPVVDAYAELGAFARKGGQAIGQNDLWIAATARATGATLLTFDRDFDFLHPAHIEREWVDQNTLR